MRRARNKLNQHNYNLMGNTTSYVGDIIYETVF